MNQELFEYPNSLKDGRYEFQEELMVTNSARIAGYIERRTGAKLIAKFVANNMESQNEVTIMKMIQHNHCMSIFDVTTYGEYLVILMIRAVYGDLFSYIKKYGPVKEEEAAIMLYPIADLMKYVHMSHIIHRDIKPENLVIPSFKNEIPQLMLIDFGCSTVLEPDELRTDECGTWQYGAPEVRHPDMGHSYPVDVWSFGATLYALLIGRYPFDDEEMAEDGIYSQEPPFDELHSSTQELIAKCLDPDPDYRPTFEEILDDEFFDTFFPDRKDLRFDDLDDEDIDSDDLIFY